ncbi:hypothetical protein HKD37_12G033807 [Glycine soja]
MLPLIQILAGPRIYLRPTRNPLNYCPMTLPIPDTCQTMHARDSRISWKWRLLHLSELPHAYAWIT